MLKRLFRKKVEKYFEEKFGSNNDVFIDNVQIETRENNDLVIMFDTAIVINKKDLMKIIF